MDEDELRALQKSLNDVSIEHHASLDSTNNRALALARQGSVPGPTLILADQQTAGRGRGTNAWWSAAGSLTFSLVIPAEKIVPPAAWPTLSLATGLAVCEVVEELAAGTLVGLKWPNDVFLNGKKVCGVLIETVISPLPCLIIGLGMNINNSFREAPEELKRSGTSLRDELGHEFSKSAILSALVRRWQRKQADLHLNRTTVVSAWQRYCILTGQIVRVELPTRQVTGRCVGIDEEGALLVQTELQLERIMAGTVRFGQEME